MTAEKSIHVCLFLVELVVSIFISLATYHFLKLVLPCKNATVAAAITTLSALWFVHVTLRTFQLFANTINEDKIYEDLASGTNDPIMEFRSRMKRDESHRYSRAPEKETKTEFFNTIGQSKLTTEARQLIQQTAIDNSGHTTKMSVSILAIVATVILQCSIRLFALLHGINRTFRIKRQQSEKTKCSLISFFDVPFTIGKSMSLGGRSFFVFYFLDRWLYQSGVHLTNDDNNVVLQAVSFDQIAMKSSHIILLHRGLVGLSLGDIEIKLTAYFKRSQSYGQKSPKASAGSNASVSSIAISVRMKSLEFGIIPLIYPLKIFGFELLGNVVFDTGTLHVSKYLDPKHSCITTTTGIDMIHQCTEIHVQKSRYERKSYNGAQSKSKADQSIVVSWGAMQSSFCLLNQSTQSSEKTRSKEVVASISIPSGHFVLHSSRQSLPNQLTNNPSLFREASILLGNCACVQENICCQHRFDVGLDFESMPKFLLAMNLTLRDFATSMIVGSAVDIHDKSSNRDKPQKQSQAVKNITIDASFSPCIYISMNDNDAFYYTASNASLCWSKVMQPLGDCSSLSDISEQNKARLMGINLQYCDGLRFDVIRLGELNGKLAHLSATGEKCIIIDVNHPVVRTDDNMIKQFSGLSNAFRHIIVVGKDLSSMSNKLKRTLLSNNVDSSPRPSSVEKSSLLFDAMNISFSSVDAIVELKSPNCESHINSSSSDDTCIRVAILQSKTLVQIRCRRSTTTNEKSFIEAESDVLMPNELFDSELRRHDRVCVTKVDITKVEVSVGFQPHASLPVIIEHERNLETMFYGRVLGLNLQLASPPQSQVVCASAAELQVYELLTNQNDTKFFSIPIYNCHIYDKTSSLQNVVEWPMIQSHKIDYKVSDMVDIFKGAGTFCRVERNNCELHEKLDVMSIQINRNQSPVHIHWSSVFMWLQESCNLRIQKAIDHFKTSLSGSAQNQKEYKCRTTRIRFLVNSNTNAFFHIALGKKTVMHLLVENGMDLKMSTTKHQTFGVGEMMSMKPDLLVDAGRVLVSFNHIESPTFVFGGLCFRNITRPATSEEISEYMRKKSYTCCGLEQEIVTDWNNCPVKEIFDLTLDSCTAKFHPSLLFGVVTDDLVLTPRALDMGLDNLKQNHIKRVKKFQLMSIKVVFSFLDIALLDDVSSFDRCSAVLSDNVLLQDIARAYFEKVSISIERNTPPGITQSQIAALDEDTASTHVYGPTIQGGKIHLTIDHAVATLIPLNLSMPLVVISNFDMNGNLYLTGISPGPDIGEERTSNDLLLCHHSFGPHLPQCWCCYGVTSHSSSIPVKIYIDCKVTCDELDANYGPVMNFSIPLLMKCIERLLPPPLPNDEQTDNISLTWWDNVRYFIHGKISVYLDVLSIRWMLDAHYFLDHSVLLTCNKCSIDYHVGYFGIGASGLNVSIPGISYDMSVHPSQQKKQNGYFLPHEVDAAREERHPVIYVPSIAVTINFSWQMLSKSLTNCTSHHSPYVNRQHIPRSHDKFAVFRSDGLSNANFQFKFPGTDIIGNWILLRIDVLPWFTHVNSTILNASDANDNQSESFPRFHSVDIGVHINELKLATWFTNEKESDLENESGEGGFCITLKSLAYTATGGEKDLVIEGPVKAALLDVSEFLDCLEQDVVDDDDLREIERACQNYGKDTDINSISSNATFTSNKSAISPFARLQEVLDNINELDYVANAGQIDIQNKSLESILGYRTSLGGEEFAGVNKTTWSILVSQLKILWTLDIRDSLMALTQDLIFTIGFMGAQLRHSQVLVEEQPNSIHEDEEAIVPDAEEGVEVTLSPIKQTEEVEGISRLQYLLRRNSSSDLEVVGGDCNDNPVTLHYPEQKHHGENASLPTIDIHFSNPQVQLHRKSTGGSIILASEGIHLEGRKFVRFLVDSHKVKGKLSPSDLLRRTEHTYTLTNMQAYSLNTRVDVTAGLPWLEVYVPENNPGVCAQGKNYLEERFGIARHNGRVKENNNCSMQTQQSPNSYIKNETHVYIYPPHLRHHEPLAFIKTGFCSPILNKFTFKSRQTFHRSPIHYSVEELRVFISRGLVSQDHDTIDEVDLKIDFLHFKLDSYQFKTTFDIIRNVLLEPPKPRRHRNFDGESSQSKPQTSSNRARVNSAAALEMEEALASDHALRGKHGREKLRNAAITLLRDLEDRHVIAGNVVTRRISYTLKKLKWCINSPESIDDVQIAFIGFFGRHDYSSDGSVSTQFSLEDVRVSTFKPGPDSICFPDPTNVIKPVLEERSPCQICSKRFDHADNDLNSCVFHDGEFDLGGWSCCKSTDKDSLGCKRGPHTGKERAALVRVEALPRIVEGITLYSHFEVSIFPGNPSITSVQISKSLSKLFMNYFFVGDEVEDFNVGKPTDVASKVSGSNESISTHHSDSTLRQKSLLIGGKGSQGESLHIDDEISEIEQGNSAQSELVLIKVWRVGYINAEISVAGFRRIPQKTVDIRVNDYSKAYKIGSWAYLGQKYLTFLVHETLKSGASSAIFKRKMNIGAVDEHKKQYESSISTQMSPIETHKEELVGRHSRERPVGAETFLGTTPAIQSKAKSKGKVLFAKK